MIEIGLQELEAKIWKGADEEIKRIEAEKKREIRAITDDFTCKAEEEAAKLRKDGDLEREMLKKRILSNANTQVKGMVSEEKSRILDEIFEQAHKRILELNDSEKKKILHSLAENGRKAVRDPVILVDEKYKGLLKGAEASKLGDFGVVVTNKEKTLRIDNTLGSRIKQLKVNLKPQLASILFAEE